MESLYQHFYTQFHVINKFCLNNCNEWLQLSYFKIQIILLQRQPPFVQLYYYPLDSIRLPKDRMNTPLNLNQTSKRTLDFRQKYKTEKCRYWYQRGFCPFFQFCAFAHAEFELRDRHVINQNYKTKICTNFKNQGFCKYGERCQFLHVQESLSALPRISAQSEHFPSISCDKRSVSTNEQFDLKHQNDLKLLQDFGLDIWGTKKGNRSQKWRSLISETCNSQDNYEWRQWSQGLPERVDFQEMFPEYNFSKKPRLGSI